MGLVKHKIVELVARGKAEPERDYEQLLASLDDADAALRRQSAREIAHWPQGGAALVGHLKREEDPAVREAILNALVRSKDALIVDGLVDCLRSDNAALRNEIIETFKQLGPEVDPILASLLADPDPDLRIFAVNILESQRHPEAESWLIEVIEADSHVNVCATAVDLLCEVGTEASSDSLARLKARFASEPYIQFASDLALKRIREA